MGKKLELPLDAPASTEKECRRYLACDPGLASHERLDLYRRLYWYRLYKVMERFFPFLHRLFGTEAFEQKIAAPYLCAHPSRDWDLNGLGDRLPAWLEEHYTSKDAPLVLTAARLDLAYHKAMTAGALPPLTEVVAREQKLYLQPYIEVFAMTADFFALREAFLAQDVSYWMRHPFPRPTYGNTAYFVLYRASSGIVREEICETRHLLLSALKRGKTLEELSVLIDNGSEKMYQAAASHLQEWFLEWTCNKWLTTTPS